MFPPRTAVIYTDTLQTVIMLSGAAFVAAKSYMEIGGWQGNNILPVTTF